MLGADDSLAPLGGARILVIRPGALGDTLLAFPALASLRRAVGPTGAVELVGSLPAARLAHDDVHASAVHSFDRALFGAFFEPGSWDEPLTGFLSSFQYIVAWSNLPRLRELARSAEIVEGSSRPPVGAHASDHLSSTLAPLGIDPGCGAPELVIRESSHLGAARFLNENGLGQSRFIAIHPSSGSLQKNWPWERFAGVARRARQEGLEVLWIEGESDRDVVRTVARSVGGVVARHLELAVLAALLARATLYLGNDSGVSHLAAAAGAPTVALFGTTDPASWAPRGRTVEVVDCRLSSDEVWGKAVDVAWHY
ncbi:MAG TPA: glycosyltransferase family 9 protein [Vicinamibacteria bacterium]|nr:glycosyltransferase family 9 protein [Vicinamibacteria bacterium]